MVRGQIIFTCDKCGRESVYAEDLIAWSDIVASPPDGWNCDDDDLCPTCAQLLPDAASEQPSKEE